MAVKTILYDVLSNLKPPQWSSNALRTRLALNFLEVPYETVFLSYPDIEPTLSKVGLKPSNPPPYDKQPRYTLPVIKHGETWVSGAFDIALYLAKQYPVSPFGRALFPGKTIPLARLVNDYLMDKVLLHARKLVFPRVPTWLDDRGATYFRATRAKWLGMPLEEYYQDPDEQAEIRKQLIAGLKGITRMLKDYPDGPFLQGEIPSYSDLNIIAVLAWLRRGEPDSFNKAMSDPEIAKLWGACEAWLA